ncbi:MAG: hypothetical protein KF873_14040 [Gemmataceae bacterium]|nr:hypothetical protein [Gemmataceae bacterium]
MQGTDTRYCSGDDIRAGDRVRCAGWTGRVAFVLGTGSFAAGYIPADWAYLGRGFMVEYDQAGLVFAEEADEDLELVARAVPAGGV